MKIKYGDYLYALKKSKKIFIFADKTSNAYQIETDKYSKLNYRCNSIDVQKDSRQN